jgi:hypothetical protein
MPFMYWDITNIELLEHLKLKVTFFDGLTGTVQFEPSHLTGVFASLKDPAFFGKAHIESGVVTWPDGIDLAPDAMHQAIKNNGVWILR